MPNKKLHYISLIIGLVFWIPSIIAAIFFHYPHFYTAFVFGGWLVLDFIDWKLTSKSILAFFYEHKHRIIFIIFFIFSSIFCFLVDYVYGVRLSGMWQWTDYKLIQYIRMYLFMNISYILSMYELFRVVRAILSKYFIKDREDKNTDKISRNNYILIIILGLIFILLPLYTFIFNTTEFIEYIMIFPFLGMMFISDGFTGIMGGNPIFIKIIHLNHLHIISIFFTVIIGAFFTETINLFGGEWKYLKVPFGWIKIFNIPISVFIGWIPLVLGSIAIVHFVKQLSFKITENKKIIN
jgi:hypothetical protein